MNRLNRLHDIGIIRTFNLKDVLTFPNNRPGRELRNGIANGVKNAAKTAEGAFNDPDYAGGTIKHKYQGSGGSKRAAKAAKKKSKKKSKKKKSSKKSKSSGGSKEHGATGGGPSASQRLSWETGTGLPFSGSMAAQLVHAVMFRFILGDSDLNQNYGRVDLLYHYRFFVPNASGTSESHVQFLGVRNLIDMDIPDDAVSWIKNGNRYNIFNPDEAMIADPPDLLQFEGTLQQFIQELSNAPFNEVYWTHEEEYDHLDAVGNAQRTALKDLPADPYHPTNGNNILSQDYSNRIPHATLHFRQTPFQERDWVQLPVRIIRQSDIIDFQLDRNDVEQYSVFNITNEGGDIDNNETNSIPVTDDRQELQRRYGYKYLDVNSYYFLNTNSFSGLSSTDLTKAVADQDRSTIPTDAWITYPSVETFNDYFGPDSASQIVSSSDPHLMRELPLSSKEGGESLYQETLALLHNHLDTWVSDEIEFEVAMLFISYINSLRGAKSPLEAPSGDPLLVPIEKVHDFATDAYARWQQDLSVVDSATQATNNTISNDVDSDERKMVTNPNNVYRTYNLDTGTYEKDDQDTNPVITYQKAGQLIQQYLLQYREGRQSDVIGDLLKSSAVKALNPWLAQVEKTPKTNKSVQQQAQQVEAGAAQNAISKVLRGDY